MKKTATIIVLALFMSLIQASAVWAALHPDSKHIQNRWYTVDEDETPYVEGMVSNNDDDWFWGGQYYFNDQTFFNMSFDESSFDESITKVSGSYLWGNGFFLGVGYTDWDDDLELWGIHPGYRWNLEHGYIAFSLDLDESRSNRDIDQNSKGLELNWLYYLQNMKIKTDVMWSKSKGSSHGEQLSDTWDMEEFVLNQAVNYKVREDLVLGFALNYSHLREEMNIDLGFVEDGISWSTNIISSEVGFTWEPGHFILNGLIMVSDSEGSLTKKGCSFKFIVPICRDFELGVGYGNLIYYDTNHENKSISFQYNIKEDSALRLGYSTDDEIWSLLYHRDI